MEAKYITIDGMSEEKNWEFANLLSDKLNGKTIIVTDPFGTKIGQVLSNIHSEGNEKRATDKTMLLVEQAARTELLETIIQPALEEGKNVISIGSALKTKIKYEYTRKNHIGTDLYQFMYKGLKERDFSIILGVDIEKHVNMSLEQAKKSGLLIDNMCYENPGIDISKLDDREIMELLKRTEAEEKYREELLTIDKWYKCEGNSMYIHESHSADKVIDTVVKLIYQ